MDVGTDTINVWPWKGACLIKKIEFGVVSFSGLFNVIPKMFTPKVFTYNTKPYIIVNITEHNVDLHWQFIDQTVSSGQDVSL